MIYPLAYFGIENTTIVLVIGLLLFGRRLPEMGRSLGKGIVEFKKGLAGIEDDIEEAVHAKPQQTTTVARLPSDSTATKAAIDAGYKFDPYTGKPLQVDPVTGQPMRFDPYTGKPIDQEAQAAGTNVGV
jgi:sec-independent protein translocase protein TatA